MKFKFIYSYPIICIFNRHLLSTYSVLTLVSKDENKQTRGTSLDHIMYKCFRERQESMLKKVVFMCLLVYACEAVLEFLKG